MATLQDLVDETLPGCCYARFVEENDYGGSCSSATQRTIDAMFVDLTGGSALRETPASERRTLGLAGRLWSWSYDPAKPGVLTSVTCDVEGMPHRYATDYQPTTMKMTVLESVKFGPVKVRGRYLAESDAEGPAPGEHYQLDPDAPDGSLEPADLDADADVLTLPLDKDHVVHQLLFRGGGIGNGSTTPSGNNLWPFAVDLDSALVEVYAYELDFDGAEPSTNPARCKVLALNAALVEQDLLPNLFVKPVTARRGRGGAKAVPAATGREAVETVIEFERPVVVVVVSMAFCRARADYEPTQNVSMARFFPHVIVASSIPLEVVTARTKFKRPDKTSMPSAAASDAEGMDPRIRPYFIAEQNDVIRRPPLESLAGYVFNTGNFPIPLWDNLFTHHDLAPSGLYCAVRRDSPAGWIHNAIEHYDPSAGRYVTKSFRKCAGQGEFDNLHWAPTMQIPQAVISNHAGVTEFTHPVVMAPVCFHDCLHMHWRWAELFSRVQTLGWSRRWEPNAVQGAPLIPPNQSLYLSLPPATSAGAANELTYLGVAQGSQAGQMQVFGHHGGSYALPIGFKEWGILPAIDGLLYLHEGEGAIEYNWTRNNAVGWYWSVFYFCIRYYVPVGNIQGIGRPVERLRIKNILAARTGVPVP